MNIRSVSIRYVGMVSRSGHREYRFEIEGHAVSHVIVAVKDSDFAAHRLMFQEAPDLCYQKLLQEMAAERALRSALLISSEDLVLYRESHAKASTKRLSGSKRPSTA